MCRFIVLCFLVFALKGAQGQTTQVTECIRNKGDLPIHTYVEGCIEPPCVLPQLEDAVINVVFKAPYLLHSMKTKALAIVSFIIPVEINYDLQSNAVTCNFFTNTYCPILQNEVVQYTLRMYIESFFPVGISATIEFRVEDKDDIPVWCIRVPIRVASPRNTKSVYQVSPKFPYAKFANTLFV